MKNVAKNWTNANPAVVPALPAGRDATKTITNALTDVNFCSSYRILYRNKKNFLYAFQKPLSLILMSSKNFQKTKQLLKLFAEKWIFYEIYSYPWCMN